MMKVTENKIKKRAVFLDRDGVINEDYPSHPHKIEHIKLIRNSARGISLLNRLGFLVIIITNQAGIAKNIFKRSDTIKFNEELLKKLSLKKAKIDQVYFCPHHPEAVIKRYKKICECRKPGINLLKQAAKDFNIDFSKSYFIGDKITDIRTGEKAGCKTILVLSGYGKQTLKEYPISAIVKENLYQAIKFIEHEII